MKACKSLLAAILFSACIPVTHSQVFSGQFNVNSDIPDGILSGLSDTRTIPQSLGPILNVTVTLNISGTGFGANNGDYYAYLTHGSAVAVLLNRPGLRNGSRIGYDDNGFSSVTFSDSASNGDVHNYRMQLFGDQITPIGVPAAPLTGTWQPDGRYILPRSSGATFDSASRDKMLDSFQDMNMQGDWTLFISDASGGGTGRLESWGMTVTAVPEPRETALVIGGGLLALVLIRRKLS
jgi:subtilisin-like proprotein convertase family protein